MRIGQLGGSRNVHMVTQARRPMSEDIAYRQRRYLWMMGFRAVCFGITILLFLNHFGWVAAIPAVFAIFIPYVAVVFANGGREPDNVRGFMEYRPNLPERRPVTPGQDGSQNGHHGPGDQSAQG